MAAAKTCDRCGKVMKIEDPKTADIQLTYQVTRLCFSTRLIEYFDLCDECLDDFKTFLKDKPAT